MSVGARQLFVGFDQAFAKSGWCILEWMPAENKIKYVESGVFSPSIKWGHKSDAIAFLEHQYHIKTLLTRVSSLGKLNAIGIEGVAFSAPGQAASRGGIWALYSTMSVLHGDVVVLSPTSMKKYMTEFGFSDKDEIKAVVSPRYGIESLDLAPDEYDAIGICEMAVYAFFIYRGSEAQVKKLITPAQFLMFRDKTFRTKYKKFKGEKKRRKVVTEKMVGICDRIDDLYITKRDST